MSACKSEVARRSISRCAVFVLFGFGPVLSCAVVYACQMLGATDAFTWRCAFGVGAALSLLSVSLRYLFVQDSPKFKEVQRERSLVASDGAQLHESVALADTMGSRLHTSNIIRTHWRPLIGTCAGWLVYDIIDYGLGLYSSDVLKHLRVGDSDAAATRAQLVVQIIALPGCALAVLLVPRLGRRGTQLLGTAGMLLTYTTLAVLLSLPTFEHAATDQPVMMVSLYSLQLVFDYMGPGATTYIIPGEL